MGCFASVSPSSHKRDEPAPGIVALPSAPAHWCLAPDIDQERPVMLYAQACQVFLDRCREPGTSEPEPTAEQQCQVLAHLAYEMMERQTQSIPSAEVSQIIASPLAQLNTDLSPTTFLTVIGNTSGLLLESAQGMISFAHLTFQEYLAATHI